MHFDVHAVKYLMHFSLVIYCSHSVTDVSLVLLCKSIYAKFRIYSVRLRHSSKAQFLVNIPIESLECLLDTRHNDLTSPARPSCISTLALSRSDRAWREIEL